MSLRRSSTQHSTAGSWQNKQRRAQHMRRCNAPSDDLRPSGEDPSRIAVIIDEAHSGIPDDGAFINNMAAKRYGKRHTQCTTSRMSQAYCQGWSHTLHRPTRQSVLSGDTICLVSCAWSDSGWGPMAVLYEGRGGGSRSIPTTKLHSRMLAAYIATDSSQGSPASFHDMATCERPSSIDVLRSIHLTSYGPTVAPTVICSRRA